MKVSGLLHADMHGGGLLLGLASVLFYMANAYSVGWLERNWDGISARGRMMADNITYTAKRAALERMLQSSNENYRAMLLLLEKISAAVSENDGSVNVLVVKLQDQQQHLEEQDMLLNHELEVFSQAHPGELTTLELLEQRIELMGKVKQMNELLLPKISGIMSLISHEIGELRGGRNAISGYRVLGKGSTSKLHYTA